MRAAKVVRRLVEAYPVAMRAVEHQLRPRRCVLATAIGVEVLRLCDVNAYALSVDLWLANRPYIEAIINHESLTGAMARGAWALVAGTDDPESGRVVGADWHGHLVVLVPSIETMLDLDFRQMNRPARGIVVPDVMACPWPRHEQQISQQLPGELLVQYRAKPDDTAWEVAHDWQQRQSVPIRGLVDRVRRAMKML